jgi:DNA-binding response OmpR family regulator
VRCKRPENVPLVCQDGCDTLGQVWGPAYRTETNYLRVHLANLRRKLEPDPARPRYLITEPGIGYRFQPDADN